MTKEKYEVNDGDVVEKTSEEVVKELEEFGNAIRKLSKE